MADLVSLDVEGAVATIRLQRPPMNALGGDLVHELGEAAREVRGRDDVRAVVVTGGPKVFAAGADIKEMSPLGYPEMVAVANRLHDTLVAIATLPMPVVAAVNGYALGGGCELALATDRRIVASDATLGQPEILLGLIPGAGGTQRLTRLVGPARAKDLCFTGRFVKAEEALAIGLVDEVVEPGEVYDAAVRYAAQFANGPRVALRAAKEAIDRGQDVDLDTGLALEKQAFAALFATEDQKRGTSSFLENGPGKATFVGR